jgi:hypothetical protein
LTHGLLTRVFSVELGCSAVLVDHAAEDSMVPDRGVERDHGFWIVVRWVLVEALVRAVIVEMVHVLVEDGVGSCCVDGKWAR